MAGTLIQTHRPPPLPVVVLAGIVSDPALVREAYVQLRRKHPRFPDGANVLTTWYFLWMAGLPVPYAPGADRFARILEKSGWKRRTAPKAGDVFCVLGERPAGLLLQPRPVVRVGVVGKLGDGWFLAADERLTEHRPYRMSVEEAGHFLHYG